MKKVLHIFGIMNRGGAELRTLSTVDAMKNSDVHYDYLVLSGAQGVLDGEIKASGSTVHYCKLGPKFLWQFFSVLKRNRYDVVHSHVSLVSGIMLLLAYLCRVKVRIAHFRSTHDVESPSVLRKVRDVILRGLLRLFATHIAGVSQSTLQAFWCDEWRNNPKFKVIYNGFAEVDYAAQGNSTRQSFWQAQTGVAEPGPWIIHVARMHEQKNHPFLIEVFCQLRAINPNAKLVLIGREDEAIRAELDQILVRFGGAKNVFFSGEQSNVLPFMLNADVMLFPSKWEGLPGAVMEAARVGLPVMGSDIPPIVEVAEKLPCVQAFPLASSATQWAKHLNEMLQNEPDVRRFREQFRASEFQLNNNVKQLLALYH